MTENDKRSAEKRIRTFTEFERLPIQDPWFEIYELPSRVLAFYEPGHFQEVISFLILGSKRSLLFDTGMGIGDIKPLVNKLAPQELIVVNSHFHFDHIGANHLFPIVHIFDDVFALDRLRRGYTVEEMKIHLTEDQVWRKLPDGFDPETYHIPPGRPEPIRNGHAFDLGDRVLKVIHTPGHSPDSIMLHDAKNRVLFTGDTFYPAPLYAHFRDDYYGYSDLSVYRDTMKRLSRTVPDLDRLYCSHDHPVCHPVMLQEAYQAFEKILTGRAEYALDAKGRKRYEFDGFAVLV